MACTAVSIEPWPVMSATSVRGRSFLTFSRNSRPDMWGMTMSERMMWTDCSSRSARADSPLSASRQTNPRASPTVQQSLRMVCSSSTISRRMRRSSLLALFIYRHLLGLPKSFRNDIDELLDTKGLFHAGSAGFAQRGHGFLIRDIAGDEHDARREIRPV